MSEFAGHAAELSQKMDEQRDTDIGTYLELVTQHHDLNAPHNHIAVTVDRGIATINTDDIVHPNKATFNIGLQLRNAGISAKDADHQVTVDVSSEDALKKLTELARKVQLPRHLKALPGITEASFQESGRDMEGAIGQHVLVNADANKVLGANKIVFEVKPGELDERAPDAGRDMLLVNLDADHPVGKYNINKLVQLAKANGLEHAGLGLEGDGKGARR